MTGAAPSDHDRLGDPADGEAGHHRRGPRRANLHGGVDILAEPLQGDPQLVRAWGQTQQVRLALNVGEDVGPILRPGDGDRGARQYRARFVLDRHINPPQVDLRRGR